MTNTSSSPRWWDFNDFTPDNAADTQRNSAVVASRSETLDESATPEPDFISNLPDDMAEAQLEAAAYTSTPPADSLAAVPPPPMGESAGEWDLPSMPGFAADLPVPPAPTSSGLTDPLNLPDASALGNEETGAPADLPDLLDDVMAEEQLAVDSQPETQEGAVFLDEPAAEPLLESAEVGDGRPEWLDAGTQDGANDFSSWGAQLDEVSPEPAANDLGGFESTEPNEGFVENAAQEADLGDWAQPLPPETGDPVPSSDWAVEDTTDVAGPIENAESPSWLATDEPATQESVTDEGFSNWDIPQTPEAQCVAQDSDSAAWDAPTTSEDSPSWAPDSPAGEDTPTWSFGDADETETPAWAPATTEAEAEPAQAWSFGNDIEETSREIGLESPASTDAEAESPTDAPAASEWSFPEDLSDDPTLSSPVDTPLNKPANEWAVSDEGTPSWGAQSDEPAWGAGETDDTPAWNLSSDEGSQDWAVGTETETSAEAPTWDALSGSVPPPPAPPAPPAAPTAALSFTDSEPDVLADSFADDGATPKVGLTEEVSLPPTFESVPAPPADQYKSPESPEDLPEWMLGGGAELSEEAPEEAPPVAPVVDEDALVVEDIAAPFNPVIAGVESAPPGAPVKDPGLITAPIPEDELPPPPGSPQAQVQARPKWGQPGPTGIGPAPITSPTLSHPLPDGDQPFVPQGAKPKGKTSPLLRILLAVLATVAFAGAGYGAWEYVNKDRFFPSNGGVTALAAGNTSVDFGSGQDNQLQWTVQTQPNEAFVLEVETPAGSQVGFLAQNSAGETIGAATPLEGGRNGYRFVAHNEPGGEVTIAAKADSPISANVSMHLAPFAGTNATMDGLNWPVDVPAGRTAVINVITRGAAPNVVVSTADGAELGQAKSFVSVDDEEVFVAQLTVPAQAAAQSIVITINTDQAYDAKSTVIVDLLNQ